MASFTDVGKGGSAEANISATIDRVRVQLEGEPYMLAAVHEMSSELKLLAKTLQDDERFDIFSAELSAIRATLEKIAAKDFKIEVRQPEVMVSIPEFKPANVFTTVQIPARLYYVMFAILGLLVGILWTSLS